MLIGVYAMNVLDARHHRGILFVHHHRRTGSQHGHIQPGSENPGKNYRNRQLQDRSGWLPLIALGIGSEVGFSLAGAGALGQLRCST